MNNDYANFEGFCEEPKKALLNGDEERFMKLNKYDTYNYAKVRIKERLYTSEEYNTISVAYKAYVGVDKVSVACNYKQENI